MYGDTDEKVKVPYFVTHHIQSIMALPIFALCLGLWIGAHFNHTPSESATGSAVTINNPPAIVDRGCSDDPKLTNDQIIVETNKCSAGGLDAEALHCGENADTITIQCKPK
jgi:hypothetical protein